MTEGLCLSDQRPEGLAMYSTERETLGAEQKLLTQSGLKVVICEYQCDKLAFLSINIQQNKSLV